MKTLIHKQRDTSICIYKLDGKKIVGSFFKEKPSVGDIIMSHMQRETNYLTMYLVVSIDENKDAKVSNGCSHNPEKAWFKLTAENVTHDPRFETVDNSIDNITK